MRHDNGGTVVKATLSGSVMIPLALWALLATVTASGPSQSPAPPVSSPSALPSSAPPSEPPTAAPPLSHFHHLHLSVTDPAEAIAFFTGKFDCERGRIGGKQDAVWAQKSWLLFDKVKTAAPWELTSAIWHMGWGAEDMPATYQKQLDSGTKFFTPITHVPQFGPNFHYAYVDGPGHALIELNSTNHHHFGHLHLFSADPVSAGEWYMRELGAVRRGSGPISREPRFINGNQIGPSMSLMMDNVNLILYPVEYSKKNYADHWKPGQTALLPTRGRVIDHLAVSVDDLADTLRRLRADGVKVVQDVRKIPGLDIRSAFVEGPDQISVELVEGHAGKE
jgi:catechol 2,3-dioxygenase-like lactoylglutathione lyase family enzyme